MSAIKSPLVLAGAAMLLITLFSAGQIYRDELLVPVGQHLADCGKSVASVVPADAHIIVATDSLAVENGTPNNYEEPNVFYYSERYGWSLPADWDTPQRVEEYRAQGAQYLVVPFPQFASSLTDYLQSNTSQVGPGLEAGCGIYQFNKSS